MSRLPIPEYLLDIHLNNVLECVNIHRDTSTVFYECSGVQ